MGTVWAVVVAGGSGTRYGGSKQYDLLGGRPVVAWSVAAAREACDGVVLVLPGPAARTELDVDAVVAGGDSRSESVRQGLAAVPADAEIVVVHDAARPLAGAALFTAVIEAVRAGADAAYCAVPVTDTLRRAGGGTIDRSDVLAVQTPQAFRAPVLRAAHRPAPEATDDAGLVEASGGSVVAVEGSPTNIKITYPRDLLVAAALLGRP